MSYNISKKGFNFMLNKFEYNYKFSSQFDLEKELSDQIINFDFDEDTMDELKQSIVDSMVNEFRMSLNSDVFGDPGVDITGTFGMTEKQYKKQNG